MVVFIVVVLVAAFWRNITSGDADKPKAAAPLAPVAGDVLASDTTSSNVVAQALPEIASEPDAMSGPAPVVDGAFVDAGAIAEPEAAADAIAIDPVASAIVAVKPKPGARFARPEYPSASLRAKEQGEVTVSVCVDAQGRMSDAKLVQSSGFLRLDDATLKSLSRSRLEPARDADGKAVPMCSPPFQFTYVWELAGKR